MIRRIKRRLGIRFSSKGLVRNPAVYLRQMGSGFRGFPELAAELLERRTATILQVGANDGVVNDPIGNLIPRYRENVRKAVLIEPQTGAFERLAERYRDMERVICLNAAIGHEIGERALYSIDPAAVSALRKPVTDRIASFDRWHVERFLRIRARGALSPEALSAIVVRLTVPVTTLERAAGEAGIDRPDILLVDAEGFDGEIVGMALDAGWRPELLQWEHSHLTRPERRRLARRLAGEGYRLWADQADIWGQREVPDMPPTPERTDGRRRVADGGDAEDIP